MCIPTLTYITYFKNYRQVNFSKVNLVYLAFQSAVPILVYIIYIFLKSIDFNFHYVFSQMIIINMILYIRNIMLLIRRYIL